MRHQLVRAQFQLGHSSDCRHQGGGKFRLQLTVQFIPLITARDVSADIRVEKNGVTDAVRIGTVDAQVHIAVKSDPTVDHPEFNRCCGSEFVVNQFLGVKIVNTLILAGISTVCKTSADFGKCFFDGLTEFAGKNTWLTGVVPGILSRLRTEFCNLPLVNNDHTLTVRNGNARTVGNDVIVSLFIGRTFGDLFLSTHDQNILIQCVTVKKFLPLVREDTARGTECGFYQSHNEAPFDFSYSSICTNTLFILYTLLYRQIPCLSIL